MTTYKLKRPHLICISLILYLCVGFAWGGEKGSCTISIQWPETSKHASGMILADLEWELRDYNFAVINDDHNFSSEEFEVMKNGVFANWGNVSKVVYYQKTPDMLYNQLSDKLQIDKEQLPKMLDNVLPDIESQNRVLGFTVNFPTSHTGKKLEKDNGFLDILNSQDILHKEIHYLEFKKDYTNTIGKDGKASLQPIMRIRIMTQSKNNINAPPAVSKTFTLNASSRSKDDYGSCNVVYYDEPNNTGYRQYSIFKIVNK
ncbi:MAG: hypothetical protein K0R49_425 [Burkholderiales bacterium]|jgi:hypothetical protein|nr:hypothetical protein [Burkholderiales bacterium]